MTTAEMITQLQNAQSINQIEKVLNQANLTDYVHERLSEQYDYQFQSNGHTIQYFDANHRTIGLSIIKNDVITVIIE